VTPRPIDCLRPSEVAELAGCSRELVRRCLGLELDVIRPAGTRDVWIRRDDAERWAQHREKPRRPPRPIDCLYAHEVAELAGCGREAVRQRLGVELDVIQIGRERWIRREDALAWIAARSAAA